MEESNLLDEEKIVYEAIQEYLKKKDSFKIDRIKTYLNSNLAKSLNFNLNKIDSILRSLIKKRYIIPGSKITRNNVLKNGNRTKIYKFIKNEPGVFLFEIKKSLNLGSHQVTWHTEILKEFQFIRSTLIDNHEVFFKHDIKPDNDKQLYYLRNKKIIEIIKVMKSKNIPLKTNEISKLTEIHYNTIKKYLSILNDLGFIKISMNDNYKTVFSLNNIEEKSYKTILKNIH